MSDAELLPKEPAQPAPFEAKFADISKAVQDQLAESRKCVVTDPTEIRGIEASRAYRLSLRKLRTTGEKVRKELKEDILRAGRAIDGAQAIIEQACAAEEKRLLDQEQIAERIQAEREAKVRMEREAELLALGENPAFHGPFETFPADDWQRRIDGLKLAKAARDEAERKAKEEAEARAKAEREDQERIRAENARLKAEADAREAAMKAEREAAEKVQRELEARLKAEREAALKAQREADAKAQREREAMEAKAREEAAKLAQERAKAEAEAKALRDAEAARLAKIEADKRAAEAAPDVDKLKAYISGVLAIPVHEMSTHAGKMVVATIAEKVRAFGVWAMNIIGGIAK